MKINNDELMGKGWLLKKLYLENFGFGTDNENKFAKHCEDGFVEIDLKIDGIEVDVVEFLKGLEARFEVQGKLIDELAEKRAKQIILEKFEVAMDTINDIASTMEEVKSDIEYKFKDKFNF